MPYIGDIESSDGSRARVHAIRDGVDGIMDEHEYQMDKVTQQHYATMNYEMSQVGPRFFGLLRIAFRIARYLYRVAMNGSIGERLGMILGFLLTFLAVISPSMADEGPVMLIFSIFVGPLIFGGSLAFIGGLVEQVVRGVLYVIGWIIERFSSNSSDLEQQEAA